MREHVGGGGSVIYISHRLEEIFEIAQRVTVLRDGAVVGTVDIAASGIDQNGLISMMVGREIGSLFPDRAPAAESGAGRSLVVRGLLAQIRPDAPDLEVRPGEILGIAGLIGSGRTELVEALFGSNPALELTVEIDGRPAALGTPAAAAAAGIALVPEDRRQQGLVGVMSVGENLTLTVPDRISRRGWISRRRQRDLATSLIDRLEIRTFGPGQAVGTLSGGNQQKVVIAKWMARDSRIFIFDEPTKGVDVGARSEIYRQIVDLAGRGRIVLVVSSELIEILGLSDRVLVMHDGAPSALLDTARTDEEEILRAAFGTAA
jgi:ribose transport system ATP-binding protein